MPDDDNKAPEPQGDAAAGFIHDLANDAPPKSLDTVKAASDALDADGGQGTAELRRERIERRAYDLWEADGGHHGSHEDYWYRAEAEIAAAER